MCIRDSDNTFGSAPGPKRQARKPGADVTDDSSRITAKTNPPLGGFMRDAGLPRGVTDVREQNGQFLRRRIDKYPRLKDVVDPPPSCGVVEQLIAKFGGDTRDTCPDETLWTPFTCSAVQARFGPHFCTAQTSKFQSKIVKLFFENE